MNRLNRFVLGFWNTCRQESRQRRRVKKFVNASGRLELRSMLSAALVSDVTGGTAGTGVVGTIYEDLDSNGVKTPGENGISGGTVFLDLDHSGTWNTDAAGVPEPSAVTNVDGDYVISHLRPGTYRVAEILQAGWEPTAPISQDVTVVLDQESRANFFNFSGGAITGTVWNDLNADGLRAVDPLGAFTDPGLAGWQVYLDLNNNLTSDPSEPSTITDADGLYGFTHLAPGDYEVIEVPPAGWDVSPTFDTKQTAAVVARQEYVADFANFSLSNGAIQGTAWNDIDGNGIRAVDGLGGFTEPGLDGWTIFLDLNHNCLAEASEPSTFTDANGNYTFVSVPAGDVEVAEVVPTGWYVSTTFDSRQTVSVLAGETVTAREFANFTVLNGSIRGVIWNDLFRDGVRNVAPTGTFSDPGLTGWSVFLDLNRNKMLDLGEPQTLTDTNGGYQFLDLQVGDYEVQEVLPTGWEVTPGHSDSVTATVFSGAETVAQDFANFNLLTAIPGSIQGTVWDDLNNNGIRDLDPTTGGYAEPGQAGRTVFVDANSNGIRDGGELAGTSGIDGSFTIAAVLPGTIRIVEEGLAGWHFTSPSTGIRTVSLKNGESATGLDFGSATLRDSSIRGVVFADTSKNGTRESGEHGLAGVVVYLDANNNGTLDPTELSTTTSADEFYTPTVDESGSYSFTHLPSGTYTVRMIVSNRLSATPASELVHTVTIAGTESKTGFDTAAVYRMNEIHGVRFDDSNGNHVQDSDELGVAGVTVYVDSNRNNILDADERTAVTGTDGSYSITDLSPGAYVVRQIITDGSSSTYPQTTSGILWPGGVSNPAVGNVTPGSISLSLGVGESQSRTVSITLPGTGALTNLVDVFLLFDDTGSFVNNSPIVRSAFPSIISQLQASLPGVDLGFGVGRFEEYSNFAFEYSSGRPFVLNQPIVSSGTAGYMAAIQAALNRTTPGYGGDQPETDIEALFQLVTGRGFDGNNNGSVLDSGAAGLVSTQLNPGASGDVPSFASFQADASGSVMAAAGNVGGGGFRAGALPIILLATDTGFAYQPKGESVVTGVGGVSVPLSDLTGTSRSTTPFGLGAGFQETVTALNSLGALVIGLGTNTPKTTDPRMGLEALSKLTGAINHSATGIDNGTGTPIAAGDPLYFQIASGFAGSVTNGVVSAIQNAVTNVAVDLTVQSSDPRVKIINHTGIRTGIGAGQTASFDIEFVGDGVPHRFDLQFVRSGSNVVVGSIPVVLGTPISGDGYEFEDLPEGEIHSGVDFGSQMGVSSGNHAPTDVNLTATSVLENQPANTVIGTLSTTDLDPGDTFTYSLVSGDVANFTLLGNQLLSQGPFDFEARSSYQVTVRSTDAGGLSFDKTFTIQVTNVNESPIDVNLSANVVRENQPAGTIVGTLTATDPDTGDTFNYSLVGGDVAAFSMVGNQLTTSHSFDFETQPVYQLTVRATDAGGLTFDKTVNINVGNVNEQPTGISLSGATAAENLPGGTAIGSLATTDPDAGDSFTYQLVAGDMSAFTLSGDQLLTAGPFDFETRSNYQITVRSTDAGGLSFDKTFTIPVENVNEAPVNLVLTGTSVRVGQAVGTQVGTILATDPDVGDTLVYSIVSGDTSLFSVSGDQLRTAGVFSAPSTFALTLRATDSGGLFVDHPVTITVVAADPAPGIVLPSSTVKFVENERPVQINSTALVTVPVGSSLQGGSLMVEIVAGTQAGDNLQVRHQGNGTTQIGVAGTAILYSGLEIGTLASNPGGNTLQIVLNGNATTDGVAAILKNIMFVNSTDDPRSGNRTVSFALTNSQGTGSVPVNRVVNVRAVNDAPRIQPSSVATTFRLNGPAVVVDAGLVIADPDSVSFQDGSLRVSLDSPGSTRDQLLILSQGDGVGQIGVLGKTVRYGGVVIGQFSGGFKAGRDLEIEFTENATRENVQALARQIAFATTGDRGTTSNRAIGFFLKDGDGGKSSRVTKEVRVVPAIGLIANMKSLLFGHQPSIHDLA